MTILLTPFHSFNRADSSLDSNRTSRFTEAPKLATIKTIKNLNFRWSLHHEDRFSLKPNHQTILMHSLLSVCRWQSTVHQSFLLPNPFHANRKSHSGPLYDGLFMRFALWRMDNTISSRTVQIFIPFYFRFSILFFSFTCTKMVKLLFYQKIIQIFINKNTFHARTTFRQSVSYDSWKQFHWSSQVSEAKSSVVIEYIVCSSWLSFKLEHRNSKRETIFSEHLSLSLSLLLCRSWKHVSSHENASQPLWRKKNLKIFKLEKNQKFLSWA